MADTKAQPTQQLTPGSLKAIIDQVKAFSDVLGDQRAAKAIVTVKDLAYGLESFQKLDAAKISVNTKKITEIPELVGRLGKILRDASNFKFFNNVKRFTTPLKEMSGALEAFSKVSIQKVSQQVKALNRAPKMLNELKKHMESIGKVDLDSLGTSFGYALNQISSGLQSFSDIKMGRVLANAAILGMFPGVLRTIGKRMSEIKDIDIRDTENTFGGPLKTIADGLRSLAELNISSLFKNVLLLPRIAFLFRGLARSFADKSLILISKKIGKPLHDIATSFDEFSKIKFFRVLVSTALLGTTLKSLELMGGIAKRASTFMPSVVKAAKLLEPLGESMGKISSSIGSAIGSFFGALGKNLKNITLGSLALTVISGALYVSGKALQTFVDISWKDVLLGVTTLSAVTVGLIALGAVIAGGGFVGLIAGIAGLAAASLSLVGVGMSLEAAAPGFAAFGDALSKVVPQLAALAQIGGGLMVTAAALGALSVAMVAFASSSIFSGAGGLFGKILGVNPVDRLKELAALGNDLDKTATAMERIQAVQNGSRSDQMAEEIQKSDKMKKTKGQESESSNVVSSRVQNTSSSTTIYNNSWVPDKTSLFVLAAA